MELLNKARSLRNKQTDVERILWSVLRNRRLLDLKFRRQVPIDKYIVDFVCLEHKLIVELDGGQHVDAVAYDQQRTLYLEKRGFKVVRYWNHEILESLDEVIDSLFMPLTIINSGCTLALSQMERELKP